MWYFLQFLFAVLCIILFDFWWKREVNTKCAQIPTPINLPIFGAVTIYLRAHPDELIKLSNFVRKKYGPVVRTWVLHIHGMFICDLRFVQTLLSHPTAIRKNQMYSLLRDWLGDGLLISYGSKWLSRRRVITPTFHFSILEDFVNVFDQQAKILTNKFEKYADAGDKRVVDIQNDVALATLDVICESAMGVRINSQTDENCAYVRQLEEMTKIIIKRYATMSYRPNWAFRLLAPHLAKRQLALTHSLHAFTDCIIRERRAEMLNKEKSLNNIQDQPVQNDDVGIKRRQALLDVLLSATIDDQPLTDADIREEVDTFMFEGHDTTKSGIAFILYCISRNAIVQAKLYAEIIDVLGTDTQMPITQNQLVQLKYTELVIKEALRMYPPVPYIGRTITEDIYVDEYCIPKGTSVLLAIYELQNDAAYYPDPHRFLPERAANENTFAFIPFSAGPRNCIGQRFAMQEMKAFVARIIQKLELLPLGEDVAPQVRVVLNSTTGWQMGFRRRSKAV